ncbi:MAG: peptidylprolyl isomerase [Xanthomonadales bacterium]|nr:peptidylprolyl isomerase [Xanthomonadales bacterium]
MARSIPVIMDAGALSDAVRRQSAPATGEDSAEAAVPVWVFVADTPISEADIAREMQFHRADDPHRAREDAARALVVRELLRREIARQGLADSVSAETGESAEEAAIRVLLEQDAPVPDPDEAACRRYYEQNQERLHHPDRVQLRHILLAAPPADIAGRDRAREKGERLIAELRQQPHLFTDFALRYSECPSREQGGELGWIERGDTTPEFERQVFMLKPGLAGLTVESRWGHHVVQIDSVERGEALSFDEARPRIAAYLEAQVRQNAIHQYLQLLAERYGVRGLEPAPQN